VRSIQVFSGSPIYLLLHVYKAAKMVMRKHYCWASAGICICQ